MAIGRKNYLFMGSGNGGKPTRMTIKVRPVEQRRE